MRTIKVPVITNNGLTKEVYEFECVGTYSHTQIVQKKLN